MKHFFLSAAAIAAAVILGAPSAHAQAGLTSGFQIGASGGVAIPTGDLGNATSTGYNVAVDVGLRPAYLPLGVRLEAAYNQFGFQGGGGNINIPAFTGNLVFSLPIATFSPYAIGGVGLYRPSADIDNAGNTGAENHFGWNIGGGIKIPLSTSFETFVEARYTSVIISGTNGNPGGNLTFIPITAGILF